MPVFPCGGTALQAAPGAGKWPWGGVFLVGALWGVPERVFAQENPANIAWKDSWFAKNRPGVGTNFAYIPATDPPEYNASDAQASDAQLPENNPANSGYDWFEAHANVYDPQAPGTQIGVVAVGFFSWANWMPNPGEIEPPNYSENPYPNAWGMETFEHRHFYQSRACVVMYDMQGTMLWWKPLQMGRFFGVVYDPAGYIVTTGMTEWGNNLADMQPNSLQMLYNPTVGQTPDGMPSGDLSARQMTISKFNLSGDALWCHVFNTPALAASAALQVSEGQDIVLVNNNGATGYRAVGYARADNTVPVKPFIVDVDNNGYLVSSTHKRLLNDVPGFMTFSGNNVDQARAASIGRLPAVGGDKYAITGWRAVGAFWDAWLLLMDDAQAPTDPLNPPGGFKFLSNTVDHALLEGSVAFNEGLSSNSSCVEYAADGDVIWPVLVDYTVTPDGIFDTPLNREARAVVHRIDWSGANPALLWSTDLKAMRAYNIQADAAEKPNGDIVFASTKWPAPFTLANPLNYAWLSTNEPSFVQNCLNNPNSMGYDQDPNTAGIQPYNWSLYPYSFWNTNLYCALLRGVTGSLVWHGTYDDVEGAPRECAPMHVKQKECIFSVSAADDGDVIMSGTSSANFDDCYVVKLEPSCDAKADYSYFEEHFPFNSPVGAPNNVLEITSAITWGDDPGELNMNVRGSVVIKEGGTLTITNGAQIHFADSRKMGYPCNIVVMPDLTSQYNAGGNLNIIGNATVTSLAECPESMWDGVQVLGQNSGEALNRNGQLVMNTGGTIRNALAGATNCVVDPLAPTTATASSRGGIIQCSGASFVNNVYDVVFRSHNSGQANDFTNSYFYNNNFITDAALNYADQFPRAHIYASGMNRLKIGGNTFDNTYGVGVGELPEWGTGVRAISTAIQVTSLCTGGSWDPNRPQGNQTDMNTFHGLLYGVNASSTDPSKITWVRDADLAECVGSIRLNNVSANILRNEIVVPDVDPVGSDIDAPYGIGAFECTGFTVENNRIEGSTGSQDYSVGAVFSNTGDASNRYYNNTFDRLRIGTIIQLDNDGGAPGDGLQIRCNDYGNMTTGSTNTWDIAFDGVNPSVGDKQGAAGTDFTAPAGNTFSSTCVGQGHMYAPIGDVPTFTYFYHDPNSTSKIVLPTCVSGSPNLNAVFQTDFAQYTSKLNACPGYVEVVAMGLAQRTAMEQAEQEYATLRTVYDSERDGGDTEGLKETVADPASTSNDIRNALMLAAPRVSTEVWEAVFLREEEISHWHMAQALVANSPLQPEVMRKMEESRLTTFYKDLVAGAQGGGFNTLTILEGEMAHWKHLHDNALNELVHHALVDESGDLTPADVLAYEEVHPQMGLRSARITLLMAQGDYTQAKAVVEEVLQSDEPDHGLTVLNLYLDHLVAGGESPSAAIVEQLQNIAAAEGNGQVAAENWLNILNHQEYPERIILPNEERSSATAHEADTEPPTELLSAYPNPASVKEPIYLVARLLEGMENGTVRVLDPTGRLVLEQNFTSRTGIVELDPSKLTPGLYVAGLFADDLRIGTTKFQVVR